MGEYFVLVNDSVEQIIDPDNFPDRGGIKHTAWMTQSHTSILAYLVTETASTAGETDSEPWLGQWAGDSIRLVGSTHEDYGKLSEAYSDISVEVYNELDTEYDWFPSGALNSETSITVSNPEETRTALDDKFNKGTDDNA